MVTKHTAKTHPKNKENKKREKNISNIWQAANAEHENSQWRS